ncbi:MAG: polysaccharide pyruvyl transferase family protein [Clostridiales bacterium]|jgi:polysaccharide pyruvyl transferase WcaK-like protein|nr:polysaccharide pyruvyl transferase family protein [Eubacteriales bacterium]MDH7566507.1 polysaccharide pyruvyl transferase family protein [Clostridiales bacterium]
MQRKILLVGASLNSGNRGVNALTRGTINALIDYYKRVDIRILSYTVKERISNSICVNGVNVIIDEIPCRGYESLMVCMLCYLKNVFPRNIFQYIIKKYNHIYKELANADLILDLSEGDSFSDIYGIKRFIVHSTIKISTFKLKKKIFLLPQTIGPFNFFFVKKAAAYILKNVNHCFVRDLISYEVVSKQIGIIKNKISYAPDMAFYMKPNPQVSISDIYKNLDSQQSCIIGVNVSGLLYNGGYTQNNMFNLLVDYKELMYQIVSSLLLKNENTKILFIPHVISQENPIEDDLTACKCIYDMFDDKYTNRFFLLNKAYSEDKLKSIIGECDFFIGARMHACIGAISMYIPTVPIAYSRKFLGIWEQFDLGECIADPRVNSLEDILGIVESCFKKKDKIKQKLLIKMEGVSNEILNVFKKIDDYSTELLTM